MPITYNGTNVEGVQLQRNGYTFLNYIETTGVQYINTGVYYDSAKSYKTQIRQEYTTVTPDNQIYGFTGNQGNGIGTYLATWWEVGSTCYANTIYDMEWYMDSSSFYRKFYDDDANGGSHGVGDLSNNPMLLFAAWTTAGSTSPNYYCHSKLYSCKIYENDVLIRDFVPAVRQSDLEVGLYDLVSNTLYTNQGADMFYCEECIAKNSFIKEVDYIQTTGAEYISLNYGFDRTDVVEFTHCMTDSSENDAYLLAPSTWNSNNNRFAMGRYTGSASGSYTAGFGAIGTGSTGLLPAKTYDFSTLYKWVYKDNTFSVPALGISCDVSSITFGGATTNLQIGRDYSGNRKGRIGKFRHYKNGVLVADLVPVYMTVFSVGRLFDKVTKQTLPSSASIRNYSYSGPIIHPRTRLLAQTTPHLAMAQRASIPTYTSANLNSWFPLSSDSWSSIINTSDLSSHIGEYIGFKVYLTDTARYAYCILKLTSISGTTIYTENIEWGYGGSSAYFWTLGQRNIL